MRLDEIEWNDKELGGVGKAHHTFSYSSFEYRGRPFVGCQWYRRVGLVLRAYQSLIIITSALEGSVDHESLKGAVLRVGKVEAKKRAEILESVELKRDVVVISDQGDSFELDPLLDRILEDQ